MPDSFDVAVIGAGPAGGSAAFWAAKAGLSAVILEEHEVIGEPVHCGECLSNTAMDRMGWKFPKEVVSFPVKGVRTIFPNNDSFLVTEPGVVLEKHLWEQWIAKQAQDAGAQLELGHRVKGLRRENNAWKIDTAKGEVAAKILIDGSGVQSVSNTLLKLSNRFSSVVGIQYELKDIPRDDYMDFYLWPELSPHGYLWMIPKSDGRANVGLVTDQNNKAKPFLDEFVRRKNWQNKTVVKTFGGLIPSSGALEKTVSDGLMLIGDAAGFTSPLFEGGSQLGLMSGKLAAETAKEALDEGDASASFLKKYESRWKNEFPPYQKIIEGKKKLYALTDDELNEVAAVMPKEMGKTNYLNYLKVGLNITIGHPHLWRKGVRRVFDAFKYSRSKYYGW
ncbi:MAG: NAD(P)/FAD-dependent oxidoreductase [Candidatus Diapherotrites archaeon]|nr:NAD(P)/FAD-dependent oxidoreductase [Candidatus Diapherotrites archaeon]